VLDQVGDEQLKMIFTERHDVIQALEPACDDYDHEVKRRGLHLMRLHPTRSGRSEMPVTRTLALTTGVA
jgi:hypothetical protein